MNAGHAKWATSSVHYAEEQLEDCGDWCSSGNYYSDPPLLERSHRYEILYVYLLVHYRTKTIPGFQLSESHPSSWTPAAFSFGQWELSIAM